MKLSAFLSLVPVLVTGFFFCTEASALPMPDCSSNGSVFCDDSWRGYAHLANILSHHPLLWDRSLNADNFDFSGQLLIFIQPESIPPEFIDSALKNGARILAFDESQASVNWYRKITGIVADSMNSPETLSASHINGNPNLPVFPVDPVMKNKFSLPDKSLQWQIAFNHPSPVVSLNSADTSQLEMTFVFDLKDSESGGAVFVIRDESFPTHLMLNTLQNAQFVSALVDSLCDGISPCPVHLFEPESEFIFQTSDISDLEDSTDLIVSAKEFMADAKESVSEKIENIKKSSASIPFTQMLLALFSAWAVLALAAAFPWGRTKSR